MIASSKVTSKGQITFPYNIRREMQINTGDTLLFEVVEGGVMVRKPKDLMDYLGFLGKAGLPDNEEELLTPEVGRAIRERA